MIGSLTYLWSVSQLSLNTIIIHNLILSVLKVKWSESESRSVVSDSLWPHGLYSPWDSPGQNTGVGSLSLLQHIFLNHESKRGLLHCGQILYQLSYEGSPRKSSVMSDSLWPHGLYPVHRILQARILDWVAFPFSRGSSQPRDRTQVSHIAGKFFTSWASREAQEHWSR